MLDSTLRARALSSAEHLDRWVTSNGWAGYDPHDVKGTPIFLYLSRPEVGFTLKVIRRPILYAEKYFPMLTRRLFGVKPTVNAKGMGLFARAYLQLYQATGVEQYRRKALDCLDWLMANRSAGFVDACWGYPFDWQSGVLTPAGTPASVVTAAVGDAFWTAWTLLGDRKYLQTCESICRFFSASLNQSRMPDGTVCFSYTPLDYFHVHNANLLVAEFLVRVSTAVDQPNWRELGTAAGQYALNEQNADGSIYYWARGKDALLPKWIDHYHSGFEIRCLWGLAEWTGREDFRSAALRYYEFYQKHLLEIQGETVAPKLTPQSKYPVNIHSCAEALILNATLAGHVPVAAKVLPPLVDWTIRHMQTNGGAFIYMINQVFGREVKSTIPYLRWGQAWMLLALSQVVAASDQVGQVGSRRS